MWSHTPDFTRNSSSSSLLVATNHLACACLYIHKTLQTSKMYHQISTSLQVIHFPRAPRSLYLSQWRSVQPEEPWTRRRWACARAWPMGRGLARRPGQWAPCCGCPGSSLWVSTGAHMNGSFRRHNTSFFQCFTHFMSYNYNYRIDR